MTHALPAAAGPDDERLYAARVALFAVASLSEQRDADTANHLLRIQGYVRALCGALAQQPAHAAVLTPAYIDTLVDSVPLYDIGNVGVPDRILLKPGRLSADETQLMRTHTTLGYEALVRAEQAMGRAAPWLQIAKELTLCHQEKWDGSGYPRALRGAQIPLSARILAVADVFDALISHRVYKSGVPHEQAARTITEGRGTHFDPAVVDAFVAVQQAIVEIALRHADTDADMRQKIDYLANAIAEIAEL